MSEFKRRRLEFDSNNKENQYLGRRPVKKNKPNESDSIQKTLIFSTDSSEQTLGETTKSSSADTSDEISEGK